MPQFPHATDTSTLRLTRLNEWIVRIHATEDGSRSYPDPSLSPWARERIDRAPSTPVEVQKLPARMPDRCERLDDGSVRISFNLQPGERLYGAADSDSSGLDRRGDHVHLTTDQHPVGWNRHELTGDCSLCERLLDDGEHAPDDTAQYGEIVVPLVISSTGYAAYVSNGNAHAVLDLGATDPDQWSFTAPRGDADVYVIGPGDPTHLVREYHRLTGTQPLPPTWALGYIQSRFGYASFDEALAVVDRFEHEGLPLHAIVFDVQWLDQMTNFRWNPNGFTDPDQHLREFAQRGVRTIVISEPGTRSDASNFAEGDGIGAFARAPDGSLFDSRLWFSDKGITGYDDPVPVPGALLNVFNEAACDWWYGQHIPLAEHGVDAWWLDLNEPEHSLTELMVFPDVDWPEPASQLDGHTARNWICLAQQRAFARRDREHRGTRPFVLSRAGTAGSQRYGTSVWTGDIGATWQDMRRQIRLGLTAGMCGIPLIGHDIGGFHGDPGPELLGRWMQMGSFWPICRAHGSLTDREPWSQGDTALAAARPWLLLRGRLLPSIASWTEHALAVGEPVMRPLLLDWPDFEPAQTCEDQWMLGPLLIAPVLEPGASTRRVILPPGDWIEPWTGTLVAGPCTLDVPVEATSVPVYVRAGSVLFVDPDPLSGRGHAWPPTSLEAWAFPRADGTAIATLYVDDGVTLEHEHGEFARLEVSVSADRQLTVTRINGSLTAPSITLDTPSLKN